jgi:hypothetical protein
LYRINDKEAAIEEIQKYLHFVNDRVHEDIGRIAIDGIFGMETEIAVRNYQDIIALENTGRIDYETFTELYKSYKEAEFLMRAEDFLIDSSLFPLKEGDQGNSVLLLNLMLDELSYVYTDISKVKLNNYYSKLTAEAVMDMRKIFMLPESREFDAKAYERMMYEIEVRSAAPKI